MLKRTNELPARYTASPMGLLPLAEVHELMGCVNDREFCGHPRDTLVFDGYELEAMMPPNGARPVHVRVYRFSDKSPDWMPKAPIEHRPADLSRLFPGGFLPPTGEEAKDE